MAIYNIVITTTPEQDSMLSRLVAEYNALKSLSRTNTQAVSFLCNAYFATTMNQQIQNEGINFQSLGLP